MRKFKTKSLLSKKKKKIINTNLVLKKKFEKKDKRFQVNKFTLKKKNNLNFRTRRNFRRTSHFRKNSYFGRNFRTNSYSRRNFRTNSYSRRNFRTNSYSRRNFRRKTAKKLVLTKSDRIKLKKLKKIKLKKLLSKFNLKKKFIITKKKGRVITKITTKLIRLRIKKRKLIKNKKIILVTNISKKIGRAYFLRKKAKMFNSRMVQLRKISSKITVNLFRVTYDILLSYHVPFGKRIGESKTGIQLTNILLIRNDISILNITTLFFELRKAINRLFKALKLRKGVAILNGRRYAWRRRFTFLFEKWLPGFFTNFYLNINELFSYFFKIPSLTRRQKNRVMVLKLLNYDNKFMFSRKKKKKTRLKNFISYLKLPSVSVSFFDNLCWIRECLKEGISTIQLSDTSSYVEKLDYSIVSNQQSLAFLSFISLLFKEVAYQARYWELKSFKRITPYKRFSKLKKKQELVKEFLLEWVKNYEIFQKKKKLFRTIRWRRRRYNNNLVMKRELAKLIFNNSNNSSRVIIKKKKIKKKKKILVN